MQTRNANCHSFSEKRPTNEAGCSSCGVSSKTAIELCTVAYVRLLPAESLLTDSQRSPINRRRLLDEGLHLMIPAKAIGDVGQVVETFCGRWLFGTER